MINVRGQLQALNEPWVMGIINLTPDSFFAHSRVTGVEQALATARQMAAEGADILDLGAASTRPGAALLDANTEWQRLGEALVAIRKALPQMPLSVDTYHSITARRAADLGADMINDISGGTLDEDMIPTLGALRLPYILMHLHRQPDRMQKQPMQGDPLPAVSYFFSKQLARCYEHQVSDIILDIGLGFGKTLAQNYQLLAALPDLQKQFPHPFLIGASRKSMITKLLNIPTQQALNGSTAVHTLALAAGASIIRVHDVAEAVEAKKIVSYYLKNRLCPS